MGLTKDIFIRLRLACGQTGKEELRMLELGNQTFAMTDEEKKDLSITETSCKPWFEKHRITHVSVDIMGQDGSLPLDLSDKIALDAVGGEQFDVVTNLGTSEHVDGQYACFENMHRFCKRKGLMVHALPHIGHWEGHCRFYYDFEFFMRLARECDYAVRWLERIHEAGEGDNVFAVLMKSSDVPFCSRKTFDPFIFMSANAVTAPQPWRITS